VAERGRNTAEAGGPIPSPPTTHRRHWLDARRAALHQRLLRPPIRREAFDYAGGSFIGAQSASGHGMACQQRGPKLSDEEKVPVRLRGGPGDGQVFHFLDPPSVIEYGAATARYVRVPTDGLALEYRFRGE